MIYVRLKWMHLFALLFLYKNLLSKILYKCLYKPKYIKELQFCQSASKIKCLQQKLSALYGRKLHSGDCLRDPNPFDPNGAFSQDKTLMSGQF